MAFPDADSSSNPARSGWPKGMKVLDDPEGMALSLRDLDNDYECIPEELHYTGPPAPASNAVPMINVPGADMSTGGFSDVDLASASPCSTPGLIRRWQYQYDIAFPVLSGPDATGPRSGKELKPGETFLASEECDQGDGIVYLKLQDQRGWVFEKIPTFSPLCTPAEDLPESEVFDIDDLLCRRRMPECPASRRCPAVAGRCPAVRPIPGLALTVPGVACCLSGEYYSGEAEDQMTAQLVTQLHVSSQPVLGRFSEDALTRTDSFDITFTPRMFGYKDRASDAEATMTARQRDMRDQLELPDLPAYPELPRMGADETKEQKQAYLRRTYQDFAFEMTSGMYLTQLASNNEYFDVHCQLVEDMSVLRQDQNSGCAVEFPLPDVTKAYTMEVGSRSEYIIVVEFPRRKLAFVFRALEVSNRFLVCLGLIIQRSQLLRSGVLTLPMVFPYTPPKRTRPKGPGLGAFGPIGGPRPDFNAQPVKALAGGLVGVHDSMPAPSTFLQGGTSPPPMNPDDCEIEEGSRVHSQEYTMKDI